MKTLRRILTFALAILTLTSSAIISVSAAGNNQKVIITKEGQIVDTLNGVPARYTTKSSDTGIYCCADYVKTYYENVFGVDVVCPTTSNVSSPVVKTIGYSFKKITSGISVGDIVRFPGHWAIVKAVSGSTLTLIEQNWKNSYGGTLYTRINRTVEQSTVNAIYRLYKNGYSVNGATGTNDNMNATKDSTVAEIEDLLFDATFYANVYQDLRNAFGYNEASLKAHWITYGIEEGRVASPFFDAKWYMKTYADVAAAYGATNWAGAYEHFISCGFIEGRQGSPCFYAADYLLRYSDLKAAFGNDYLAAAKHFLQYGLGENRQASPQFSIAAYSQYNPDVARAFTDHLSRISHYVAYVQYGSENRRCI